MKVKYILHKIINLQLKMLFLLKPGTLVFRMSVFSTALSCMR